MQPFKFVFVYKRIGLMSKSRLYDSCVFYVCVQDNINRGGKTMGYVKPKIVAQNNAEGVFAASCPASGSGYEWNCMSCHVRQ